MWRQFNSRLLIFVTFEFTFFRSILLWIKYRNGKYLGKNYILTAISRFCKCTGEYHQINNIIKYKNMQCLQLHIEKV